MVISFKLKDSSSEAMPDFAQVYSFIGSVFDPNTTGHLQKLKGMDPIDVETERYMVDLVCYTDEIVSVLLHQHRGGGKPILLLNAHEAQIDNFCCGLVFISLKKPIICSAWLHSD